MTRIQFLVAAVASLLLVEETNGFQFMKNWKLPRRDRKKKIVQEKFGDKKLAVITDATSELGHQTAQALLDTGRYHVIGGLNEAQSSTLEQSPDFTPVPCRLDSFESVRAFCDQVQQVRLGMKPLDRLILTTGEAASDFKVTTQDGLDQQFQMTYLSPFLTTGLLLDSMTDSMDARVTLVGSAGKGSRIETGDNFASSDPNQCQQLLTNFLHEKYHKLTQITFNHYQLDESSSSSSPTLDLLQVVQDPACAGKSGISWKHVDDSLIAQSELGPQATRVHDIETGHVLFQASQEATQSAGECVWPEIRAVTSPCPTLKVIGAVTKGQVQRQEMKRMRELGRPGISERVIPKTRRQRIAAFCDKVVSTVFKHTVQRVAKVASSALLGDFPEEAVTGSFDEVSEEDIQELLKQEISPQLQPRKFAAGKKLVVLTGASSGLGRKTALALLRSGDYHVIGAVRDLDKMEAVAEVDGFDLDNFTPIHCELNSFASVKNFCAQVNQLRGQKPIDRVVCNAGVYQPSLRHAKWSSDGHEQTMQINFLSHFLMISLLMKGMKGSDDPRITMVGSVTGNDNTVGGGGVYPIADLHELDGFKAGFKKPIEMADGYGFIGAKAYKDSKLCLMILANFLHAKYHYSTGIAFSSMYPGCIAESPLFREKRAWFRKYFPIFMKFITGGFVGEHEAGQRLFQVVHDPRCAKSGVYWSWNGGPREGRGAQALEKGGQISGGGGAGGGWDSIFENDQSAKVLNIETGFNLFQYANEITGATENWPDATANNNDWKLKTAASDEKVIKVKVNGAIVDQATTREQQQQVSSSMN